MYSFDPIMLKRDLLAVTRDIEKDTKNLRKWKVLEVEYYGTLLATHPTNMMATLSKNIIKYKPFVGKALEKNGAEGVYFQCCKGIERFMKEKRLTFVGPYARGEMRGGKSLQTEVEVLWWVIGPLTITQAGM